MSKVVIYHNSLCPDIWDEYYQLTPEIRLTLLKIAKEFYKKTKFEAPILDIYFMGSLASFNWNAESDIDVHVVIDLENLKMPTETAEKMAKLVGSQWNSEHEIIIKKHKVEMNIQSITAEKPYVNGIYSLIKNQWIKRPSKQNSNSINTPNIQVKYNGMKKYILDTITTQDLEKLKEVKDYLDAFRQYGLDNGGELSVENITYKLLRTKGIIQKLKDAITNLHDKQLSIDENINVGISAHDIETLNRGVDLDDAMLIPNFKIKDLSLSKNGLSKALIDIKKGAKSKTDAPIEVMFNIENKQFIVTDGYHRVVEYLLKKKNTISIKVWSTTYSDYYSNIYPDDLFRGKLNEANSNSIEIESKAKTKHFNVKFGELGLSKNTAKILLNGEWFANSYQLPVGFGTGNLKEGEWILNRHEGAFRLKLPEWKTSYPTLRGLLDDLEQWYVQSDIKEVTQSDINSKLPSYASTDLKQLSLQNLKALRDKAVRIATDKKLKIEDPYGSRVQATKDFVLYRDEIKRRLEIINRPINEAVDVEYNAHVDFLERKDQSLYEIATFLKTHATGNIPWKTISATLLKKTWLLFGKYNKVNENAIDKIADQLLTNIARLTLANEFTGHSENYHLREEIDEMWDIQFTDEEWEEVCNRFEDKNGRAYISDCGIKPLQNIYSLIFNAETPEAKLYACDKALNVVHQRNDLAAMFVEGGQTTLTQIANQGGYNAGYEYGQMNREFRESLINEAITHPQSPEFKKWFGNSKVVDKHGNPSVVYHGTNQPISAFSKKRLGISTQSQSSKKAYFFTDSSEVAAEYAAKAGRTVRSGISDYEKKIKELQKKVERLEAHAQATGNWTPYEKAMEEYENYDIGTSREDDETGQNILPVFLKIENPLVYDFEGKADFNNKTAGLIDGAVKNGNDGLILKNVNDPLPLSTHYIVFKPTQIKSAIGNVGTYSHKHSSIVKEGIKKSLPWNIDYTKLQVETFASNPYWISPNNKVYDAGESHSWFAKEYLYPDLDYVPAREEALKNGWIRLRTHPTQGILEVEGLKLNLEQKKIIRELSKLQNLKPVAANKFKHMDEGFGGNPETDAAYVKDARWTVKYKSADKTPLMKESKK